MVMKLKIPNIQKFHFHQDYLCSNCHSNNKTNDNNFEVSNTLDFLVRYYSKDNIDLSSVENFAISLDNKDDIIPQQERKASIDQYSMIEINNDSTQKSGFIRFMTSVVQRFPLYFFISFVIIIFFARSRYCKAKRERYTL